LLVVAVAAATTVAVVALAVSGQRRAFR